MNKNDPEKIKTPEVKPRDDGVELENQFIMRLPDEPSKVLHEALQTGNLKDRMTIKLDPDLRYGEVRLDHWLLHAKVVDLPTIIECLKTIDNKSFYKTADICQLMICKEEPDEEEKESPNKGKKKDPNKVDKKFLWPHGITPPCKNVRKRRFRKTLKKKNVEAPEIEKEVKRLFRIDNEAVKVEYEIINEDIDKAAILGDSENFEEKYGEGEDYDEEGLNEDTKERNDSLSLSQQEINVESDGDEENRRGNDTAPIITGVGEHDIFGEEVSSSDDDEDNREKQSQLSDRELDEASRFSADDTQMSTFSIGGGAGGAGGDTSNLRVDEMDIKEESNAFAKALKSSQDMDSMSSKFGDSNSNLAAPSGFYETPKPAAFYDEYSEDVAPSAPQMDVSEIKNKISDLRYQYNMLKAQHTQKAQEISSLQNQTLRMRLQETLDNLFSQMTEKETELRYYESLRGSNTSTPSPTSP